MPEMSTLRIKVSRKISQNKPWQSVVFEIHTTTLECLIEGSTFYSAHEGCRGGSVAVSDDVEQEVWDVLGSNPALHP